SLLAFFYWSKQRSNKKISHQNVALQRLVEEKEWLLKEVHHRVKNNLHTVVSLLESQSAFLRDDALAAVLNSQNRVYTMSLIHQKLYKSNNSTTLNMATYLPELVHYLQESYDVRNRIKFNCRVQDLQLNGSMAVPVGLIVNEAVTNSIKYAFAEAKSAEITITLLVDENKDARLCIADNGCGIQKVAIQSHHDSLGLSLMKGLCEDIGGQFRIDNNNGTRVMICFPFEVPVLVSALPPEPSHS
ncbi:MAG: sensor histidine kinase, partial [Sphingobacteriales bacterium]